MTMFTCGEFASPSPSPQEIEAFLARRAAEIFERLDRNDDGVVTEDDIRSAGFWRRLQRIDANADGQITQQEIAADLAAHVGNRIGPRDRRPGQPRPPRRD